MAQWRSRCCLQLRHVLHSSEEFAAVVEAGYRPARFKAASDELWSLIESCWHHDPLERPSMAQVVQQLQALLDRAVATGGKGKKAAAAVAVAAAGSAGGASSGGAAVATRADAGEPGPGCRCTIC